MLMLSILKQQTIYLWISYSTTTNEIISTSPSRKALKMSGVLKSENRYSYGCTV